MSGQSLTFVSIARYSAEPTTEPTTTTSWYLARDYSVGNRPRATFSQGSFILIGGTTTASDTPTFPAGFFSSQKFMFATTYDAGTLDVTAYLIGKPGGTLTTFSLSAVTNAARLDFRSANLFWPPDSPDVAYMRKFRFWTSILTQQDIEAIAAAEL